MLVLTPLATITNLTEGKMQLHWPVKIRLGRPYLEAVDEELAGRSWSLVTSTGWHRREVVRALSEKLGPPVTVIDSIEPNPRLSTILGTAKYALGSETIVAVGGGSVIDAAKVIAI